MEEINYYIESNTKLYEETKKQYEATNVESEKLRLKNLMDSYKYYVLGLRDAKNYIIKDIKKYIGIEESK